MKSIVESTVNPRQAAPTWLTTPELEAPGKLDIHVAVLVSFLSPHALPMYEAFASRVRRLTVLASTPMEQNRHWKPDFGTLDVRLLRNRALMSKWRHPVGFQDPVEIHVSWDTVSQLRELRPDVVISWQLGVRTAMSAWYARSRHRPALIISTGLSEHTERGWSFFRRQIRKSLVRRADAIMVNGRSGARYLQSLGVPPEKIFFVPYTAEPRALYQGELTREPTASHRLLYAGQLIERKGIVSFTEILARWAADRPREQVDFTIVGTGPLRDALAAIPIPPNMTLNLAGLRTFEQVAEHFGTSGLFVFPTLADEWGMVTHEALHAGLPVLGSRYAQSVEDLIIDGQHGWSYRPDMPAEVEAALDHAFACSPEQLDDMRRAAHERVAGITPELASERILLTVKAALRNSGKSEA